MRTSRRTRVLGGKSSSGVLAFDANRDGAVDLLTTNAMVPSPIYATGHPAPLEGVIDRSLPGEYTDIVAMAVGDASRRW